MRKLIFFHAKWCGPCKRVERECISRVEEAAGTDRVQRVDAWNEPQTAERHKVIKLPTAICLDGETERMRFVGAFSADDVISWLTEDRDDNGNDRG